MTVYYKPRDRTLLKLYHEGLSPGLPVRSTAKYVGTDDDAWATALYYKDCLADNYFFEVQDNKIPNKRSKLTDSSVKRANIPLLATNDCHLNKW